MELAVCSLCAFLAGFLACLFADRRSFSRECFNDAYSLGYRHGENRGELRFRLDRATKGAGQPGPPT